MERINMEFFFNLEREGKKSVMDFCIKMGFIAGSYECPDCKKPMKLASYNDRQDGFVWYCKHKNIVRRSVRSGSWFQESRLSMITMLRLAYLWVKKTSYAWIADEFNMSKNTVGDWMAFFRRVCLNAIKEKGMFLGGSNEIVEIDAKSFPNIKNKQGCETWVFGGVERHTKNCFLEIIYSGDEDEIVSVLQKYVLPGTTIISDNWRGFDCLESNGYVHQKVSKSGFKDPVTGAHKNNILCLWSKLKVVVKRRIGNDQFDGHLAELMWRCFHQEDTQALLKSFFKILSDITPRVRDDPTYVSKRIKMEKENIEDCIKSESDMEPSVKESLRETQSAEVKEDNNEGENVSENESMEEIEVPLVYSKHSLSEDEFEGENGSQNKLQRTMESLDT